MGVEDKCGDCASGRFGLSSTRALLVTHLFHFSSLALCHLPARTLVDIPPHCPSFRRRCAMSEESTNNPGAAASTVEKLASAVKEMVVGEPATTCVTVLTQIVYVCSPERSARTAGAPTSLHAHAVKPATPGTEAHGQVVTPWDVHGSVSADGQQLAIDYDKLIQQFGTRRVDEALLQRFERLTGRKPHPLLRRGTFFSHR